jgi:hypothetical protein
MAQVTDEQLFAALDPEANSIAIVVEAHGGQHALALDGLPDQPMARSRTAIATPSSRTRRYARGADGALAGGLGLPVPRWSRCRTRIWAAASRSAAKRTR